MNLSDSSLAQASTLIANADDRLSQQEKTIAQLRSDLAAARQAASVNLKTPLVKAGFAGRLLAHYMGWFGEPDKTHKVTRYNSTDPATVQAIVAACKLCGIDGFVATWLGLTSDFVHRATLLLCQECEANSMWLALLLDPWAAKFPGKSKEQSLIDALTAPTTQQILNSKAYIPEKAILDFSTGADFSKVMPHVPGFQVWFRHKHYSWPETSNTFAVLRQDNANPAMKMPGVCANFFDGGFIHKAGERNWNRSVWNDAVDTRIIPDEGGNAYLDTVALVPKNVPYVGLVSLNDHDEQTAMLPMLSMFTGIRFGK